MNKYFHLNLPREDGKIARELFGNFLFTKCFPQLPHVIPSRFPPDEHYGPHFTDEELGPSDIKSPTQRQVTGPGSMKGQKNVIL